jgi:putative Holliday junction resolvase
MRYLGVDPGGKKMGLAVGDDQTGVVSPLEVVSYGGTTAGAQIIAETMIRVGAARAIIGLPALADGSLGPAARRTELLADAVRSLGIEVEVQPEYLSTHEARRRAREIGRPKNRPADDLAAQVILEDYLAHLSRIARAED